MNNSEYFRATEDLYEQEVSYKVFEIRELFRKINTKSIKNAEGKKYTNKTVHKIKKYPFVIPVTASSSKNNSIAGYVKEDECDILENMITICSNGDCRAFYQKGKFSILQDSYPIKFIEEGVNDEVMLYFLSLINDVLTKYNWNNKAIWNRINRNTISVPFDYENNCINYIYIEQYIEKIQKIFLKKCGNLAKKFGKEKVRRRKAFREP